MSQDQDSLFASRRAEGGAGATGAGDGADRRCVGVHCRGGAPARALSGRRLCGRCRDRLLIGLRSLPVYHAECGRLLENARSPQSRNQPRAGGGQLPGMRFNAAAAEVRTLLLSTLSSWAGLLAHQRRLTPPRRAVPELTRFLLQHHEWLALHPAAGELTEEVTRLADRARQVLQPATRRQVPVGRCVEERCEGRLYALVCGPAVADGDKEVEIVCDADARHRWPQSQWLHLGDRLDGRAPAPDADEPAADEPAAAAPRWLSASDITRLWGVPSGSVYRLASTHSWRRRSHAGRTSYHEEDVVRVMRRR